MTTTLPSIFARLHMSFVEDARKRDALAIVAPPTDECKPQRQAEYLEDALTYLELNPYIFRYAW